jgi:hypothetical protein
MQGVPFSMLKCSKFDLRIRVPPVQMTGLVHDRYFPVPLSEIIVGEIDVVVSVLSNSPQEQDLFLGFIHSMTFPEQSYSPSPPLQDITDLTNPDILLRVVTSLLQLAPPFFEAFATVDIPAFLSLFYGAPSLLPESHMLLLFLVKTVFQRGLYSETWPHILDVTFSNGFFRYDGKEDDRFIIAKLELISVLIRYAPQSDDPEGKDVADVIMPYAIFHLNDFNKSLARHARALFDVFEALCDVGIPELVTSSIDLNAWHWMFESSEFHAAIGPLASLAEKMVMKISPDFIESLPMKDLFKFLFSARQDSEALAPVTSLLTVVAHLRGLSCILDFLHQNFHPHPIEDFTERPYNSRKALQAIFWEGWNGLNDNVEVRIDLLRCSDVCTALFDTGTPPKLTAEIFAHISAILGTSGAEQIPEENLEIMLEFLTDTESDDPEVNTVPPGLVDLLTEALERIGS